MITKQELLAQLKVFIAKKEISRDEVLSLFSTQSTEKNHVNSINFANILSFIGGFIVFMGLVVLVSINWSYLGDIGQVLVTLGTGILAYIIGNLLMYSLNVKFTGVSFHLIGGLMIPIGIFVWLSKLPNPSTDITIISFWIFLVLSLIYGITDYIGKSPVFILFSWIFGSLAYWFGFSWIVGNNMSLISEYRIAGWAALILGVTYILIGYTFDNSRDLESKFFYLVGLAMAFGALFGLVFDYAWFEALYVIFLFGGFYLSSYLKSRLLLVVDSIYLVITIFYLSARYFVNTVGWPLAMIVTGLLFIGVAFITQRNYKKIG